MLETSAGQWDGLAAVDQVRLDRLQAALDDIRPLFFAGPIHRALTRRGTVLAHLSDASARKAPFVRSPVRSHDTRA